MALKITKKLKQIIDPVLAKALAHPIRGHILVTIGERGEASPKEIGCEIGLPVSEVSYHFRRLRASRIVEQVRTERRRGFVEHFYQLVEPVLYFDDLEWERIPAPFRDTLSGELLRNIFEEGLAALEAGTLGAERSHFSRVWMVADEQAKDELLESERASLERKMAIKERCAQRMKKSSEPGTPMTAASACFETATGA